MRRATLQDAELLLEWRNDPLTRETSHRTTSVERDAHNAWLKAALEDRDRQLFVAEEHGEPVGTVRADLADGGVYELSWTVAPAARGRGVAKRMVALLASQIAGPIRAEIKVGNLASVRVAEHAGMKFLRRVGDVLHYRRGPAA